MREGWGTGSAAPTARARPGVYMYLKDVLVGLAVPGTVDTATHMHFTTGSCYPW